jgi:hypothetical protein
MAFDDFHDLCSSDIPTPRNPRLLRSTWVRMTGGDDGPEKKKGDNCLKGCSAYDAAMSKRPANRCANAMPACIRNICGSKGNNRIARAKN